MSQRTSPFTLAGRFVRSIWLVITSPFRFLGRFQANLTRFFTEEPEDTPITDTLVETVQSRESFFDTIAAFAEHLDALRGHLMRSVIVLALCAGVSFWQITSIMALLTMPLAPDALNEYLALPSRTASESFARFLELGQQNIRILTTREPAEGIGTVMRVSLLAATVLAMPWIITEIYLFIAPGLFPKSRVRLLLAIPFASLLFAVGVLFTYFVMLPVAIPFLEEFGGFSTAWTPSSYFNLVTSLMFWVGIAFQMPLIIYALAAVGLLKSSQLLAQWRIAVIAIAVIAAIITPTTDPLNMAVIMVPMIALYFISIAGAWVAERGRKTETK
jgi:sec-independent protein translocase protein TatC